VWGCVQGCARETRLLVRLLNSVGYLKKNLLVFLFDCFFGGGKGEYISQSLIE
jgi:hypothetical protein